MSATVIENVALVGAVHGNELTPAYLIKHFQQYPRLVERSSFQSHTLIANPQALDRGVRYIDIDLNRCFSQKDLANSNGCQYEQLRAKEIYRQLQEKRVDLLIDIHSTTSNMRLSILYSNPHPWLLQLFAYLARLNPRVRFVYHPECEQENGFLKGTCQLAFTLEIGPIAQGVISANLFRQTEELVYQILDYIDQGNLRSRGNLASIEPLTVYQRLGVIDYPRGAGGEIAAMLHPNVLHRDFEAMLPNQPLFLDFEGQEIVYRGDSTVYPIFVGESAYREKGIALCLTAKKQLNL
jgi:N-acyl-aromatic-L-amino acid amidohydrolase